MRALGPDVMSVARPIGVGFLLLRYSIVDTVESLSLFYLLFISQCVFFLVHIRNKGEVGTIKLV